MKQHPFVSGNLFEAYQSQALTFFSAYLCRSLILLPHFKTASPYPVYRSARFERSPRDSDVQEIAFQEL